MKVINEDIYWLEKTLGYLGWQTYCFVLDFIYLDPSQLMSLDILFETVISLYFSVRVTYKVTKEQIKSQRNKSGK